MLSMASLSELVTFEQNPENNSPPPKPSLLAPPGGNIDGPKAILWNETELRAGWRLAIYLVLFFAFAALGTVLAVRLHLPLATRTEITALGLLVQEAIPMFAAFAAAAILGVLEGRPFGIYGLPATAAFRARFWQGIAWGLAMITGMILLIRLLGGFSFGGLALHGSLLWGYAWPCGLLCFSALPSLKNLPFAATQFTLATGVGFGPAATMLSAIVRRLASRKWR